MSARIPPGRGWVRTRSTAPRRCSSVCASFEAATVDVDSLEYREALQVVRIEGGIANNVVPDRCAVVVNRRYAPSRSLEDAVDEVVTLCTDAGADHVEVLNASMAAPPNLMNPLIAEMIGRLRPAGAAEARLDRRRALRRARDPGVQLRAR